MKRNKWLRLAILLVALLALSFGLACLIQKFVTPLIGTLDKLSWIAYLSIFALMLLSNATVIAPVPVTTAIMISIATKFDPTIVALSASLGGTLGELSGYLAGLLGKKIAINEYAVGYNKIKEWTNRYGIWAISLLAFQPILPFDVAGILAGASRMPLWKFLPALWLGKFPKYLILCYSGAGLIHFLPPLFR